MASYFVIPSEVRRSRGIWHPDRRRLVMKNDSITQSRLRLGIDLRCVPSDGSPGAGIAHAARDLVIAMENVAEAHDVEIVRLSAGNGWKLRRALHQNTCDAVFVPSGAISPLIDIPAFPWVHDLDIFDHPEWFPQNPIQRFLTTRLFLRGLRRAPVIFCVSEYTKRAIERVAEIDPNKIIVTSEGVSPHTLHATRYTLHDRALILGTIEPRKNIPFIVELWPEVCRRLGKKVELMIAGKNGWGNVSLKGDSSWLKRIESVSDDEVNELFASASLVLIPSLSEGFGRTALEAMARGIPVIASNRGALPEVVGNAGVLIDPTDREAWIRHIVALLEDGTKCRELGQRGHQRARHFNWNSIADIILENIRAFC